MRSNVNSGKSISPSAQWHKRYGRVIRKAASSIEIAKIVLCLMVSFSALFGYIFAAGQMGAQSVVLFLSVFLLSCGGASLNSLQERHEDGLLARTRRRPMVEGRLSAPFALTQALILIVSGLAGLLFFCGEPAFTAGLAGILLYNLVYTRLKSQPVPALLPGAVCGAIPPYIGWLAAGGEFLSYTGLLPTLVLFFWQVPHVFLIALHHKSDYSASLLPNVLNQLSEQVLRRSLLPWIAALAAIMLIFTAKPFEASAAEHLLLVINSLLLVAVFVYEVAGRKEPRYGILFRYLNISLFLFMALVCIASLG